MTVITMQRVETRWEVSHVSATLDFLAMGRFALMILLFRLAVSGVICDGSVKKLCIL